MTQQLTAKNNLVNRDAAGKKTDLHFPETVRRRDARISLTLPSSQTPHEMLRTTTTEQSHWLQGSLS